jgi:hypothetical protein
MPTCRLCKTSKKTDAMLFEGVCDVCRRAIGMTPMPPPRRPPAPCARCKEGTKFIRSIMRDMEIYRETSLLGGKPEVLPVVEAATYELAITPATGFGASIHPDVRGLDRSKPRGTLARYICTRCGFADVYCDDLESIPIGPEYMTDVVDYGGDGPHR